MAAAQQRCRASGEAAVCIELWGCAVFCPLTFVIYLACTLGACARERRRVL